MKFTETPIGGVWIVEPEPVEDERGFFARTFSREEFLARGLSPAIEVCASSFNLKKGTLRGMHFQKAPYEETKLVRCIQGAIYDVALDLRPHSPSFKQWFGLELSAQNRKMLYIPEGCAHGFQTLCDCSEVFYHMAGAYHAPCAGGVRFDDPAFGIQWPLPISVIGQRDSEWPDYFILPS